jgi:glucose/arabinose dehydrogenase
VRCYGRDLMKRNQHARTFALILLGACTSAHAEKSPTATCTPNDSGLKLPPGFCATIFADSIGSARHLVVAPNGDVFVNVQRSRRGPNATIPAGIVALRDTNRDGRADVIERFGNGGNTGIGLYNGFLYEDVGTSIVRFPIHAGQLKPNGQPDTIVSGMPGPPQHISRNFVITRDGTLYVNFGSPSNACQHQDRTAGSLGKENCPERESRAGIWTFNANTRGQTPSSSGRYATGLRNSVAFALDPSGARLFALPNGRDQLNLFPSFTVEQNAELPAEVLVQVNKGDDFGWPFCYFDGIARGYRSSPEYGGDGKTVGQCDKTKAPLYAFPAHWAPVGMLFYTGSLFPAHYRNGVFVAFHGSWNRAPLPQAGYNVTFLPMRDGRPLSAHEVFAEGFTTSPPPAGGAAHRPVGLAQGPDGALYISDDAGGRIYRVMFSGR